MIITLLVFFAILILLGIPFSLRLKFFSRAEQILLTPALGLGVFPILTIIMNWLSVPLHWISYLLLGSLASFLSWHFVTPQKKFEVKEWHPAIFALVLGILATSVFIFGAFQYAYLEDDDPWFHALGSKYVTLHKTYSIDYDPELWFRTYLEPYPPTYDVLMGILHQTNNSLQNTLKIFNAILLGMAHLYFYFLARKLLTNSRLALFATTLLVIAPSFASHFIWAQTLNVALLFPAILSLLQNGKHWRVTSTLLFAGLFLSQLSSAFAIAIMGGILALFRRDWKGILCISLGVLIALTIFFIPMIAKYGYHTVKIGNGLYDQTLTGNTEAETSGGKIYLWNDFVHVPLITRIDQPTGIGLPLALLSLIGISLLFWRRTHTSNFWLVIITWFIFTLAGVEGNLFPIKLFPHRFWLFFSIPVVLLTTLAVTIIPQKRRVITMITMIGILIAVIITAGLPKLFFQTHPWPPGESWASKNELQGYLQLKKIVPKNTPLLTLCTTRDEVIGLDFGSLPLDKDLLRLRKNFKELTVEKIITFMNNKKFKYMILDNHCVKQHKESARQLFSAIVKSGKFTIKHHTSGMYLFELK